MAAKRSGASDVPGPRSKSRPATTLDAREQQLVSLAVDLAEQQIRDGTASAQVITHFLRLGTTRERLEQEKLARENRLLEGRTEELASKGRVEELYKSALDSMRSYSGFDPIEDDDDEYL